MYFEGSTGETNFMHKFPRNANKTLTIFEFGRKKHVCIYRIYPFERRGALYILRASDAALIRGALYRGRRSLKIFYL
jgi:hypothetical protein